jgi:hypothetical protein
MRKFLPLTPLLLAAYLSACSNANDDSIVGNNDIQSIQRKTISFDKLKVSDSFAVDVVAGLPQQISIKTDSNIAPLITTKVKDGILMIHYKSKQHVAPSNMPIIHISVDTLNGIEVSGASKINVKQIKSADFSINTSGANSTTVAGETTSLKINTSGVSKINTKYLRADNVTLQSSGATDTQVTAIKTLDITISGGGKIQYFGKPDIIQKISGVGEVNGSSGL